jgi:hypothetical protein
VGFGLGVATLGYLNGATIVTDPTSADFMKVKIGNTRIDPWGGFQQYAVLIARLTLGEVTSSTTGKKTPVGISERFHQIPPDELFKHFLEGKLSPMASFLYQWSKGTGFADQPFDVVKEVYQRFIPIFIQDFIDVIDNEPRNLWTLPFSLTGFGLQTYKPNSYYEGIGIDPKIKDFVDTEMAKIKMGLPIKETFHGFSLTYDERERIRREFGNVIYPILYKLFNNEKFQSLPDNKKEDIIRNKVIDPIVEAVGSRLFPHRPYVTDLADLLGRLEKYKKFSKDELRKEAERIIKVYYENLKEW